MDQHQIGLTGRLARYGTRRPWTVVGIWVVLLAVAFVAAGSLSLTGDGALLVETETGRADALLDEHFDSTSRPKEFVVVETEGAGPDELAARIDRLAADLRATGTVTRVVSYRDGVADLLSDDGTAALVVATMAWGDSEANAAPVVDLVEALDAEAAFAAGTVGDGSVSAEFTHLAEETLMRGEMVGVGVALVILVVLFGAVVAAGLPLLLAMGSILLAVGMTAVAGQVFELSTFVVNMITMIGLAVGIDYALFIVQRFREERSKGLSVSDAVVRAGDTATRAVFFSGLTVVIALLGLVTFPETTMRSLGVGAIFAVVGSVLAAVTLLPAVLRLLGDRVNRLRVPFTSRSHHHEGGGRMWHRITAAVTKRPVAGIVLAGGLLLAALVPYVSIATGQNSIGSLPDDSPIVRAFGTLNEEFDTGAITTPIVVRATDVTSVDVREAVDAFVADLESRDIYGDSTVRVSPDRRVALVEVVTKLDPATLEARDAVTALRTEAIPAAFAGVGAEVLVTGEAAGTADFVEVVDARTPWVFAFVLGLSFVLLTIVFRSIVVPLKAIVMNLLSVGAAYGLLVLVFQHGWGADLLGFQTTDVIEAWVPLLLFTVLFGLSMDYHIFLLSRIKEHYDLNGDNTESVAFGLGSTGAIITGAALIMVAVFGGFAAGDLVMFQQMGFGLAVAVILDATIVRSVLVPATMALLGDRNWYLPPWLSWLPRVHIEGRPQRLQSPQPEPALAAAVD
ncbi:MAG: MMPL family transporter [Acidimicrobiia bacterium]|nr:MMPL family transporter [Acidimicrobiia bacterium]